MTHAGPFCDTLRTCEHKDVRYQEPCLNDGICIVSDSEAKSDHTYTCDCSDTYFTGFYCEEVHPCHPMKVSSVYLIWTDNFKFFRKVAQAVRNAFKMIVQKCSIAFEQKSLLHIYLKKKSY